MGKESRRLRRQFDALVRAVPPARGVVERLLGHHMRLVRVPAAILLIFGGLLSILPVLGIWMLPLGLMLLCARRAAAGRRSPASTAASRQPPRRPP